MKILHIVGSFLNGGIETLLVNVVNKQIAHGDIVALIIMTNNISKELLSNLDPKISVYFVNKPNKSKNPYYYFKLNYFYKSFSPDIIHMHSPNLPKFLMFKRKKEKRFVTIHNNTIPIKINSTVDKYIAISKCVQDSFTRQTNRDNCIICYNGVDFNKFIEKGKYQTKPYKILCIGRVVFDVKGQDIILDALNLLKQNNYSFQFDFYGTGIDFNKLKNQIKNLNLEDCVQAHGDITNIYIGQHLQDYDIFIQASRHEGLGLSAIEAMSTGIPTILSRIDGFIEVSKDGEYATMFECGSYKSLYEAIINVFKNYPDKCNLAISGKHFIKEKFSIDKMIHNLYKIYSI